MYCHALTAARGGQFFKIPCEDMPLEDGLVGMWPYDLRLGELVYSDLIAALHDWARTHNLRYRIYVTRDRFEPAVGKPMS